MVKCLNVPELERLSRDKITKTFASKLFNWKLNKETDGNNVSQIDRERERAYMRKRDIMRERADMRKRDIMRERERELMHGAPYTNKEMNNWIGQTVKHVPCLFCIIFFG